MSERDYKFDHLVYLRIFEGCNLSCSHCFIPANPKKMSAEQIFNASKTLYDYKKIKPESSILFQWHGGEPTIFGPQYLEASLKSLEEGNQKNNTHYKIIHGIQTNLLNYNEKDYRSQWKEIYTQYFNKEIGVSYDPLIRKMKSGETQTANSRFEAIFWNNLADLIEDGISPYLVITATKTLFKTYKDPTVLFDKLADLGVTKLHLERITKTGTARENWDEVGLNNLEYSTAISKWFKVYFLWRQSRVFNGQKIIHLSPFNGFEESVGKLIKNDFKTEQNEGYGCWSGSCDSNFHTIDASGYKTGCTALTSEIDNKASKVHKIQWYKKDAENQYLVDIRATRQEDCNTCEFLKICSSGCLSVEKFDHSGECSGGKKIFQTTKDILFHSA